MTRRMSIAGDGPRAISAAVFGTDGSRCFEQGGGDNIGEYGSSVVYSHLVEIIDAWWLKGQEASESLTGKASTLLGRGCNNFLASWNT